MLGGLIRVLVVAIWVQVAREQEELKRETAINS
jgi:hypothetical protein